MHIVCCLILVPQKLVLPIKVHDLVGSTSGAASAGACGLIGRCQPMHTVCCLNLVCQIKAHGPAAVQPTAACEELPLHAHYALSEPGPSGKGT